MNRGNAFLFDSSFFSSVESVELEESCGLEGVAIYLKLLCAFREAPEYSLTNDTKILSKLLRVGKKILEKTLEVLKKLDLISEKESKIFSKNILEDVSKLEAKKTKLQENALKRWASDSNSTKNNTLKKESVSDAKALQLQCKSQDKDKEKVKVKEYKGGLLRGEIENLEIPKQWDEVKIKEALNTWADYHAKDLKLPYKSITPIKALLTSLEKSRPSTELVVFAINFAMAHQWQGVSLYPSVIQAFEGNKPKTARQIEQEERERILNEWDATAFELEHPELYAEDAQ